MRKLKSIILIVLFFALLSTTVFAQTQRISCPSGDFSIIAPQDWTLIVEEEDLLVFQSTAKEAVMSFKKMPKDSPDLNTFVLDYKDIMKKVGAKLSPQKNELILETEALKFNTQIAKTNPQAPNMEGQIYVFSINDRLYFFESFGPDAIVNHADVFKNTAHSFALK